MRAVGLPRLRALASAQGPHAPVGSGAEDIHPGIGTHTTCMRLMGFPRQHSRSTDGILMAMIGNATTREFQLERQGQYDR